MDTAALLKDLQRTAPDAHVIARQLVSSPAKGHASAPAAADLAEAITNIAPESHIKGASALRISLFDPTWGLMESGIFDAGMQQGERYVTTRKEKYGAGKLNPLDINYPSGSRFWWRLGQVSPKADHTVQLTFIDRIAALLQGLKGPLKASRSAMTRAEFLKMAAGHVKDYGGIEFYSQQLDTKQPVVSSKVKSTKSSNTSPTGSKTPGLGANVRGLTVKGRPMTPRQANVANILLAVANQRNADDNVTVAIIYAAIVESALSETSDNGTYWGALSGSHGNFPDQSDTVGMATAFLEGGKGFKSAIGLSRTLSNPAAIASQAEVAVPYDSDGVSRQYKSESGYGTAWDALTEAKAIVEKGGGSAASALLTREEVQPYYFAIGTSSNPNEDFWTGFMRLANQVNWPLFTDGNRCYYDSEMTLIRQKPAAVIDRDDAAVIDWGYDWENRQIATQMTLNLICDPFEFHAGEVFELHRFGAASSGSTAGLPGRWLIADIIRNKTDLFSQFTLKQPEQPKREPAAAVKTVTSAADLITAAPGTAMAAYQASQELSKMSLPYVWGGGHAAGALDDRRPIGLDCSGSTCWVLHKAGMFPASAAAVSGDLASSWGQPGEGKYMTVWANRDHVFIEFHIPGLPHAQMNTDVPGKNGPRLLKWGPNGSGAVAGGSFAPRHWEGS